MAGGGKRKGSRRAGRPRRAFRPQVALLAVGVTLAVVAWGYLVYVAIDFGGDARSGDSRAWGFLAVAAVGAMACLFAALMLLARLSRAIGLTSDPSAPYAPPAPRPAPPAPSVPPPSTAPSAPAVETHRHRAE